MLVAYFAPRAVFARIFACAKTKNTGMLSCVSVPFGVVWSVGTGVNLEFCD